VVLHVSTAGLYGWLSLEVILVIVWHLFDLWSPGRYQELDLVNLPFCQLILHPTFSRTSFARRLSEGWS
jgi:hypothetical protein